MKQKKNREKREKRIEVEKPRKEKPQKHKEGCSLKVIRSLRGMKCSTCGDRLLDSEIEKNRHKFYKGQETYCYKHDG